MPLNGFRLRVHVCICIALTIHEIRERSRLEATKPPEAREVLLGTAGGISNRGIRDNLRDVSGAVGKDATTNSLRGDSKESITNKNTWPELHQVADDASNISKRMASKRKETFPQQGSSPCGKVPELTLISDRRKVTNIQVHVDIHDSRGWSGDLGKFCSAASLTAWQACSF
jgi:hypothetical protein